MSTAAASHCRLVYCRVRLRSLQQMCHQKPRNTLSAVPLLSSPTALPKCFDNSSNTISVVPSRGNRRVPWFVEGRFWQVCPRSVFCTVVPFLYHRSVFLYCRPVFVPSFQSWGPRNIHQHHPFGNHPFANPNTCCGQIMGPV